MKLLLVRHCLNAMAKSEIQALIRAEWGNPSKSHRFESNLEVTSFKWIVRAPETRIPEFLRFLALSPASPPYFSLRTIVVKPLPESIWSQVAHRFKNPPLDVEVTLELVKGRER